MYLLKQYIKTLVATEIVFPDVLPRQYGDEFSRTELQAIYFILSFVIKKANPRANRLLISEFGQLDEPTICLHWFLCDFWRELVPLVNTYTYARHAARFSLTLN